MIKLTHAVHPGEVLSEEFLKPTNTNAFSFSNQIGIEEQTLISLIEGRSGMTEALAQKLASYLGTSVNFWLKLQENYENRSGRVDDGNLRDDAVHPDQHAINDWLLYGPKDGRIEELVRELTLGCGLRLADVEYLIFAALAKKKKHLNS